MAPKRQPAAPQSTNTNPSLTSAFTPTKPSSTSSSSTPTSLTSAQEILHSLWRSYLKETPQRVKLIDTFMGFLILVGGLQFLYAVVGGNYPFNAFLSGFSATVGQFVLTASLRIQCNPQNGKEFESISHERAFADFVLGSLILHFFCVNFVN
ncbi:MAG: hypothetical protein Q9195_003132 [Heterodermia aff. obscurata]